MVTKKNICVLLTFCLCWYGASSQTVIKENQQQQFFKTVPKGNYSGIVPIGNDRYAIVSDKSPEDGFFIFHIDIDSESGVIHSITNEGFRSSHYRNRDMEGITYIPKTKQILICGEGDNKIYTYDLTGKRSEKPWTKSEKFRYLYGNYGLESLTYNEKTDKVWTCNENNRNMIYLQSYTSDGQLDSCYEYRLDPSSSKGYPMIYAHGVSELCALDDGRLLVLEREFFVPSTKVGSWVECKLYVTDFHSKKLVTSWKTELTFLNYDIANYEGMCIARRLRNGNFILLLCSDSQDQYGGVLKDWFKTFIIKPS